MTRLHPDDIKAIAAEVVRQIRQDEERNLDDDYEMTLSPKERNARARRRMLEEGKQRRQVNG